MGHWYDSAGQPAYEVQKADGSGLRPTTLADARKLTLSPSVTTILGIVAKPALDMWKQNQILKAVICHPPTQSTNLDIWKKKIVAMSMEEGRNAAERGTEIHDALEGYILGNGVADDMRQFVTPVAQLLDKTFGAVAWKPESSFTHPERFGGKCDLHATECYEYPNGIILDFKTKSTENFKSVKAYDEHCMQLVAYREGFNLPKAECYNLFISTHEPGALLLHKWEEKSCEKSWQMFKYLLYYYKAANNFGL